MGDTLDQSPASRSESPPSSETQTHDNDANGIAEGIESISLQNDSSGGDGAPPCDEVLYSALCSHRHRSRILQIESRVESFVVGSDEEEIRFEGNWSAFERLLVHRTAQHWGLATRVSHGNEGLSIIGSRTEGMERPEVALKDVQVKMDGSSHRQPRILTRGGRQPYRGAPRHADVYPQQQNGFAPREEREEMYERARARIFGGYGGEAMQPGMVPMMAYPYGVAQSVEPYGEGKARIRDKSSDMADPDFMRSKPYEVYMQQPMYPAEYMNGQQPMPPNVVSYPMAPYGYPVPMPYSVVPVGPDGMVLGPPAPYPGLQMPPMRGGYARRPHRHPGRHHHQQQYRGGRRGRRGASHAEEGEAPGDDRNGTT